MEIGGFIEFPSYTGELYHENAIALNSARNCLAYLIEAKKIKMIAIPKFLCASVGDVCNNYNVRVNYYSIGENFLPIEYECAEDEWFYLVNYYGQIGNDQIEGFKREKGHLIIDNVQAYFQMPVQNVDTIYTCRKYFGVPDGAFLYTDTIIQRELELDKSTNRMLHLLGRFEESANKYYSNYTDNEELFERLPLRKMSKLTENLLRSIEYSTVKKIREENFLYLKEEFDNLNKLNVKFTNAPFMYPLYLQNGWMVRKKLQERQIYIPTLWPDVFDMCQESELEYDMAKNILPLPCDQRYSLDIMRYLVKEVRTCLD